MEKLKLMIQFVQESVVLVVRILWILVQELAKIIVPREGKKLEGEVVLVTGSAQGIGRQLAKRCAELGAKVVLWDINKVSIWLILITISSASCLVCLTKQKPV